MIDESFLSVNRNQVLLSLFSGVGLLDSGFENAGFCVVRGPEKILGGDVRNFRSVPGVFSGVIAGPPCQDFSRARRTPASGEGVELLNEFRRIVRESDPDWFLMENVPAVPDMIVNGYIVQRFDLSPTDLGHSQSRLRHFQFGSKRGIILDITRRLFTEKKDGCVTASEGGKKERRKFSDFCELQGLSPDYDLPQLNQIAKYRAVGNGVHIAVSDAVAKAISYSTSTDNPNTVFNTRVCACGCGRIVTGRQKSAGATCRKRLEKKRRTVNEL